MPETYAKFEQFLAAVLRGEAPLWPGTADAALMLKLGELHGVNGLVEAAHRDIEVDWPRQYVSALAAEARQQTGHEILRRRELVRVLEAFAEVGVKPLIMKGAALAYTHYNSPVVRPRCDIDLLVAETDRDASDRLLTALGYERAVSIPGSLINNEQCYVREQAGFQHLVDLHWKINNRKSLARTFSYAELAREALSVSAIGDFALTLSSVHSILLACMHRVASLRTLVDQDHLEDLESDRLIWLYDIHLLCADLDESGWQQLAALSVEREIVAIVRDGLERCHALFGTQLPEELLESLPRRHEHSAGLLNPTRSRYFLNEFQCLNWADRLRLVKQILVPPPGYMRQRYGNNRPLVLLYLARAAGGLFRRR